MKSSYYWLSWLWWFHSYIVFCWRWLFFLLQVAGQSSAALVRSHFVDIFSICITLHCSKRPGWESGTTVLQSSILTISGISENERDTLIKRHMVCYFTFNYDFSNGFEFFCSTWINLFYSFLWYLVIVIDHLTFNSNRVKIDGLFASKNGCFMVLVGWGLLMSLFVLSL